MKNDSQSGVASLNACRMRGLSVCPAAPFEQRLGFLAAVATEVAVEEIHHRPEVASLFDVDLEQVAQIVLAWAREAQLTLLLDRRGLGVALRDDDAAKVRAIFAWDVLPGVLALVVAEMNLAILLRPGSKRCPSGSRASSRSRTAPIPEDRRSPRCADRRRRTARRPAPCHATTGCSSAAIARARAAARGRLRGPRCSGFSRRNRCSSGWLAKRK